MTPTPSGRAVHVDRAGALARGAPPEGHLAVPIFAHGSLAAEMCVRRWL